MTTDDSPCDSSKRYLTNAALYAILSAKQKGDVSYIFQTPAQELPAPDDCGNHDTKNL
jgi:hypothetical protein